MPERAGVDELELLLLVAQELPQARVVEEQASVVIDDGKACGAALEDLAVLTFLVGDPPLTTAARLIAFRGVNSSGHGRFKSSPISQASCNVGPRHDR
jgi:hypothetical protein